MQTLFFASFTNGHTVITRKRFSEKKRTLKEFNEWIEFERKKLGKDFDNTEFTILDLKFIKA